MSVINAPCICCQRSLNRVGGRSLRRSYPLTADFVESNPVLMDYLVDVVHIRQIGGTDRICRPCFQRAERYIRSNEEEVLQEASVPAHPEPEQELELEPEPIPEVHDIPEMRPEAQFEAEPLMPDFPAPINDEPNHNDQAVQVNTTRVIAVPGYNRAPFNTHLCIFVYCNNQNLQRIKDDFRTTILQNKCFYIPRGSRVCEEHVVHGRWQDIENNTRHVYNEFSSLQLRDMINILRKRTVFLDFERMESISDEVFHYYVGFNKNQFREILRLTPSIAAQFKKPANALATVLTKLHTGESNQRLSVIFKISRNSLQHKMKQVREYLTREFVPRYLGYDHIPREGIITRSLSIPSALYGNLEAPLSQRKAIVIFDGTYIYLQKSSNYYFQRKSYSLHKFRNLIKPFLMVCTDGYIIDIYGPYEATMSDATILTDIINDPNDPFHWVYKENDVFILDRGFRDAVEVLESQGYCPYMPATRSQGETQLSTQQANDSRKVTMCRWVVETINGRLKNQFRQLRHQYFNRAAEHLFQEIKIAGALLNAFGAPLEDHRLAQDIINETQRRYGTENRLSNYVIENNLNRRRADFETLTANVPGLDSFPVLTEDDLVIFALGTYQLKQARSYYGEHVKNGTYVIEVYKEVNVENLQQYNIMCQSPWLLRGRIQSRHANRRIYYVYILIDDNLQGRHAIMGHYCTCVVGKRTLGCCSHIMSIIWYLGWGRYQPNLLPPAMFLDSIIIRHDIESEVYDEAEIDIGPLPPLLQP